MTLGGCEMSLCGSDLLVMFLKLLMERWFPVCPDDGTLFIRLDTLLLALHGPALTLLTTVQWQLDFLLPFIQQMRW